MITNESIEQHRKELRKLWRSKRWKDFKAGFLKNNPVCDWCGEPARVVHHVDDLVYGTEEYFNSANCIALCVRCHWGIHHGCRLCPRCRNNLITMTSEVCKTCSGKENEYLESSERFRALRRKIDRENYQKAKQWAKEHIK